MVAPTVRPNLLRTTTHSNCNFDLRAWVRSSWSYWPWRSVDGIKFRRPFSPIVAEYFWSAPLLRSRWLSCSKNHPGKGQKQCTRGCSFWSCRFGFNFGVLCSGPTGTQKFRTGALHLLQKRPSLQNGRRGARDEDGWHNHLFATYLALVFCTFTANASWEAKGPAGL